MKTKKVKCQCPCHTNKTMKHIAPCCENGYITVPDFYPEIRQPVEPPKEDYFSNLKESEIFKPAKSNDADEKDFVEPLYNVLDEDPFLYECINCLKELCQLRIYKDYKGKDAYYEDKQPKAWKWANNLVKAADRKRHTQFQSSPNIKSEQEIENDAIQYANDWCLPKTDEWFNRIDGFKAAGKLYSSSPNIKVEEENKVVWLKELIDIRNKLYNDVPSGALPETKVWDFLQIIKWHLNDLDNFASRIEKYNQSQSINVNVEEAAEAYANDEGYPKSDKEHFETTYWTLHNIYVNGFKKAIEWQSSNLK